MDIGNGTSSKFPDPDTIEEPSMTKTLFELDRPLASLYVTLVVVLAVSGVIGNVIILFTLAKEKKSNEHSKVFLINIAIADLCVTAVADPLCIAGAIMGQRYFSVNPAFCELIACLCLTACFCVFMNLTQLTVNRYIFICRKQWYNRIYNNATVVLSVVGCWILAITAEMPNFLGWGGHGFDDKNHQCIWDRTASTSYTLFVAVGLITTPFIVIGICHAAIFRTIFKSKVNVSKFTCDQLFRQRQIWNETLKSSKNLLVMYLVFLICWTPYTVTIAVDLLNRFSMETHLFVTLLAHAHSSTNIFIYLLFRPSFRKSMKRLFGYNRNSVYPSSEGDQTNVKTSKSSKETKVTIENGGSTLA